MQQESRAGLHFLWADGQVEDSPRELANIQAVHAETVLELQKTRNLLLLEHRISKDLQVHTHRKHNCHIHVEKKMVACCNRLNILSLQTFIKRCFLPKEELKTVIQKLGNEREEMRRRMTEKNKLLSKKALQINALQGVSNNTYFSGNTSGKLTQNMS